MTNRAESAKLNWPRWQQVLLIALLVVLIGNRLTAMVDMAAYRSGLLGQVALNSGRAIPDPNAPAGFGRMVEVDPNGPVAKAGIRNGDFVRTYLPYYYQIRPKVGDSTNFTLDRNGVRSEHQIVVEPLPIGHVQARNNGLRLANVLAVIISILVGCFILWRGWGNPAAMLLGMALAAIGRGGSNQPPWATDLGLAAPMWWLLIVFNALVVLLIPFAMRMFEQQAGSLPRWHWRLFTTWLVWCFVSLHIYGWDRFWLTYHLNWAGGAGYPSLLMSISIAVAIAYLVAGWRKGSAAERNRITLIVFALSAYLFATVLVSLDAMRTGTIVGGESSASLIYFNAAMQGVVAPGLLAYAVLRHKLFDLGFAVNRTLVFGSISLILLVGFALIEWAVDHLVPKSWHEASAFYSAGIAVGLFLLFHRIRDAVEHVIERLFFRSWHQNEAALKRFVAAAAHVEKPEALAGNFAAELGRFTGGADVALYARTAEENYADASGATIDADDPALAAMRAEQGAVVPVELGSSIEAALALPMMHQAALAGFVLLGPKPTGEDYRPDEIEVLGWATQQVGLDLQAIRVRELEQSVIKLEARNANLSDVLAQAAAIKA
ncbi:hypothetical protein [Novosphingobium sp.]|uniref:hypothetical protein n=1 Tax=Novosphingobium sp. TaxID=1874826 RepID=UPI00286AE35F|nr:hypothetical protein [Novosphingobium sp.]